MLIVLHCIRAGTSVYIILLLLLLAFFSIIFIVMHQGSCTQRKNTRSCKHTQFVMQTCHLEVAIV